MLHNNIPPKVKKLNKRRDKKEPWMTNELLLMVNRKINYMLIGNAQENIQKTITERKSTFTKKL